MNATLKAFEVEVNGKVFDYRVGQPVDTAAVQEFLERTYVVKKLWNAGRHVLGVLTKDNTDFFFKLATSKGISAVTQNEYRWNNVFNQFVPRETSKFWVPVNKEEGWFQDRLYYFITDVFDGPMFSEGPQAGALVPAISDALPSIIRLSEFIEELPVVREEEADYRNIFRTKVRAWYDAIPEDVRDKHGVNELLDVVEAGTPGLVCKPRHGDFTLWHMFRLSNGKLGLIDGEHFLVHGVKYYDIGYLIQRVYSVLCAPSLADEIASLLIAKHYDMEALRIILTARGIGGYLDASLVVKPDYGQSVSFQDWVVKLGAT